MIYRYRTHDVDAVRFDGDNLDAVRAACALVKARIVMPDGSSPDRRIAIWSNADNSWDYLSEGYWVVVKDGGIVLYSDEAFTARYEPVSSHRLPPPPGVRDDQAAFDSTLRAAWRAQL